MNDVYKIGCSADVVKRMEQLNHSPWPIELIHSIKSRCGSLIEKALHFHFREKRVRGEWFSLNEEDVSLICSITHCDSVSNLPDVIQRKPKKKPQRPDEQRPRVRGGMVQIGLQVPEEVLDLLRATAERTGRSMTAELIRAIRRHHAYPEPAHEEPPLLPAGKTPDDVVDPKRGRKPKKDGAA